MRNLRKPLAVQDNLDNYYPETNIIFSPDDKHILTGLSQRPVSMPEKPPGQVVCFSKATLEEERRISVGEQSIIRVLWHPRINQLAVGSSSGLISVLYSPRSSINGALLPLSKLGKTSAPHIDSFADTSLPPVIITPHSLPMFREENRLGAGSGKRKRERERNDPVKTMKPKEPMNGPGHGGRVGASEFLSRSCDGNLTLPFRSCFADPFRSLPPPLPLRCHAASLARHHQGQHTSRRRSCFLHSLIPLPPVDLADITSLSLFNSLEKRSSSTPMPQKPIPSGRRPGPRNPRCSETSRTSPRRTRGSRMRPRGKGWTGRSGSEKGVCGR